MFDTPCHLPVRVWFFPAAQLLLQAKPMQSTLLRWWNLAHRNRSDFCDFCDCDAHHGPQKSQRFLRQEKAMLHCDLRVRWKVASDLRFRAAISEPKTPSFCGISGDLAPSTRKSLAIAIVRFWCAKCWNEKCCCWGKLFTYGWSFFAHS